MSRLRLAPKAAYLNQSLFSHSISFSLEISRETIKKIVHRIVLVCRPVCQTPSTEQFQSCFYLRCFERVQGWISPFSAEENSNEISLVLSLLLARSGDQTNSQNGAGLILRRLGFVDAVTF